ncbi:group 3 late-embryogenesis abundant protein, mitochondrial-like [Onthophagus taurus]|uniref:group 3 late-embryogenesis abundant protein, mitochondrial-like n=1 Tax=Onthophagus taurus TaxID=166361 RepID=UPI0039BDE001
MGCASSNPLVEGGKNLVTTAKESVNDVVAKGEHTIHEAGDAAKEGMEHVKEAVESAMNTVENSLGNVVGKVSNTFNSTKNNVAETIDATKENITEAVSDAETVVISEKDNAKEMLSTAASKTFKRIDSMTDEFGEAITERKEEVVDSLHIEDIEQSIDTIDTNYKDMKRKAEDLVNGLSTPSPQPPTSSEIEHEDKKEE